MKSIRMMTLVVNAILIMTFGANSQTTMAKVQIGNNSKLQSGNEEISKVKADLTELLRNEAVIYEVIVETNTLGTSLGTPKEVLVLDDRIEFKFKRQKTIMYFSDILDRNIYASTYGYVPLGSFSIKMGKKALELADDLIFIKKHLRIQFYRQQDSLLNLFKPTAAQYRELKVKPAISEEQRKFIVQANLFNQQKMYDKAIELYNKALEVDQTAYPSGYSNLALLYAQINNFNVAIFNMKKYLLLVPEATDARSAQDKIYEWEAMVPK